MLARLGDAVDLPGLNPLKTREDVDFSIALLDSWATVSDVLTFYQERIANESYKRTATERSSLVQLAHLVNYKLQPGVAANTYLAFTLEDAIGSPTQTTIGIGTKVQSLPNPGEKPQLFETIEEIEAYAVWNILKPGLTKETDIPPPDTDKPIIFQSPNTNLRSGDALLIIAQDTANANDFVKELRRVKSVTIDASKQHTIVLLEKLDAASATGQAETTTTSTMGNLISKIRSFFTGSEVSGSNAGIATPIMQQQEIPESDSGAQATIEPGVYALRVHASLFGYNAPDWNAMHDTIRNHYPNPTGDDWTLGPEQSQLDKLDLDRVYPQIIPGSWLVVERSGEASQITQVLSVTETAASNYAISSKITRLSFKPSSITPPPTFAELRQMTVYSQSEKLTLAMVPDEALVPDRDPDTGDSVFIPDLSNGPEAGRNVIIVGQPADSSGLLSAEIAVLADSTIANNGTTLHFKGQLSHKYQRATVSIYGNIALATQGETISDEVLGSGDASQPYQRFPLRQSPLTYIQAPTAIDGKASTLSITVDGLPWKEVDTFYGHGPRERIFVTHIEDDGTVTVEFGDGFTGARLPTGEDNVHAMYRKGSGVQGVVQPRQLSVLLTRPLGVKSVTNPMAPTGAVDRETIEDAKRNASNTIFTLGRIVSREDYEQYALSYASVAKAQASRLWINQAWSVYVTIAGPPTSDTLLETYITEDNPLYQKIYSGMRRNSDPTIPLVLQTYSLILFRLAAKVKVNPDNPPDQVLKAVEQAVLSVFSFGSRAFGQGVTLAEVINVMQKVQGVVTVQVDRFYQALKETNETKDDHINAALPYVRADGTISSVAELLIAAPHPFDSLEVML